MRHIGVLDCNNFFVSCERLFRPDLRRRPVVVLSSNDGCVVARSQEIKDIGIPMGVPLFQVKDILKKVDAAIFSSNFRLYRDISKRIFTLLKDRLPTVEQYSIDEAFFVCEGAESDAMLRLLKIDLERLVGIPVSIGLGATKTIAKAANRLAKKGSGVHRFEPETWTEYCAQLPLGQVWNIGVGRTRQFKAHGLETVADLVAADGARVRQLFGVEGARLQAELSGQSIWPVVRRQALQKTLMSSRSFKTKTTDKTVIEDALAYHARRIAEDLRAMRAVAGTMTVMIRPSRHGQFAFQGRSMDYRFPTPTARTTDFLQAISELLTHLFQTGIPYQKAGIMVSDIIPETAASASLFTPSNPDVRSLERVLDSINATYGIDTIQFGKRNRGDVWRASREHLSTVSTTNWQSLPYVSAQ